MPTYPHTYPNTYFSGSAVAAPGTVPFRWPTSLNGRVYAVDIKSGQWKHVSIPLLKPQQDQSTTPAETSLNPDGVWRRAAEDWSHGAGQSFFDRPESDKRRFRNSKGVDIWTPFQFSLLPDTEKAYTSSSTNLMLQPAGSRLYLTDATSLLFSTDAEDWTSVTGMPGVTNINGIASDGYTVYVGCGADGIYTTNTATGSASSYITGNVRGVVGYTKGRLLCSDENSVYNPTTSGALPTALFDHPNADFQWVGFTGGPTHIYMAGYSGDKSLIYKCTIKADGTALDVPTVAGELPDGELITGLDNYLGFIFLGTSKGARFCQVDGDGNLTISAPNPTTNSVHCFEGQDRYVWFGWSDFDSTSTGLGRLSLVAFTESIETGALTPAYASDLMATAQGDVLSVATFDDKRVFSVSGAGVYVQSDNLVSFGNITTGYVTFGLPDSKTALFFDVRTLPLEGSYTVSVSTDSSDFQNVGSQNVQQSAGIELPFVDTLGERLEIKVTLNRDGDDNTLGPIVTRYTFKAIPAAVDGPAEYIIVPFQLHRKLTIQGTETYCDVRFERDFIKLLRRSREVVVYQEASDAYNVVVDAYEWQPYNWSPSPEGGFGTPDGTMLTQLKRIN